MKNDYKPIKPMKEILDSKNAIATVCRKRTPNF